ncbi:hypothetical protein R9C00_19620 [Flammeovirgaceae bacterium SG7u.111]|nr:hypothetical protein [Flammeovirgaceae bacterium SG7u.132]WPO33911.1 hypothetical protein R9C00_19620 [Flammeovirgaceae bacterium SG7u.111]
MFTKRVLLIIVLLPFVCCNKTERCIAQLEVETSLSYKHLVSDKYIDRTNHGRYDLVLQKDNKFEPNDFDRYPFRKIWHAADIGDSLIKEKGSIIFKIVKPSGVVKYVELHCPENDSIYAAEATFYFDSMRRVGYPMRFKELFSN